jgi:hypothetical protein
MPDCSLGADYYVVTDSDLDLSGIPLDVLDVLRAGLERYPQVHKAGLSLEINDVPADTLNLDWERSLWTRRIDDLWFDALVDTTFAMYRRGAGWAGNGMRSDRPYTARHVPWYRKMDEEERYYMDHADIRWASHVSFWKTGKLPWA